MASPAPIRRRLRCRTQLVSLHWTQDDAAHALRILDLHLPGHEWAKGARVRRIGPLRNAASGRPARVTWVVELTEWKGHR